MACSGRFIALVGNANLVGNWVGQAGGIVEIADAYKGRMYLLNK
jgi:hypothetical protein